MRHFDNGLMKKVVKKLFSLVDFGQVFSDPNKFFGHPMNKAGYTAISRELSRRLVIGRRVFAVSLLMSLSQIRS